MITTTKYGEVCGKPDAYNADGLCYFGVPCPKHDTTNRILPLRKKYLHASRGTHKSKPRTGNSHPGMRYKKKHLNRNKPYRISN